MLWQRLTLADRGAKFYDARGPRLLHGNADARPVLTALLNDPSPNIRLFARIGLGMELEEGDE
jgi:hypothetical protein